MNISKIAMISSILITANAIAQEKKIQRSDLPPAVERTVSAAQNPGVTIRGFSQENEKGQTYYEAETTVNGHSKDLLMDAHGAIVEVEEQVDFDSLQPSVKDGLQAKAGTAKILKSSPSPRKTSSSPMKRWFRPAARKRKSRSIPTASHSTTKSRPIAA